jgi:hypothetical protein
MYKLGLILLFPLLDNINDLQYIGIIMDMAAAKA